MTPVIWSDVPPTADGLYWWRRGHNFQARWFEVYKGVAKWPNGTCEAVTLMRGQWIKIAEPGPDAEPKGTI